MRIFKKIILIFLPLLILGCFISYWVEPKFQLWQMDKSIILKKQELPLMMMFLPEHQDNVFVAPIASPQFVLAGPKLTLFSGQYRYKLEIIPACSNQDLGYMDVVRKSGNFGLGAKEIIAQKQDEPQIEELEFQADTAFDYEFRLHSLGECSFEIKTIFLEREKIDFRAFFRNAWQKVIKIIY